MNLEQLKTLMSITMSQSEMYNTLDLMGDLTVLDTILTPSNYKYNHKRDQNKVFVFIGSAEKLIPDEIDCIYSILCGKSIHLYDLLVDNHSWKDNVRLCHTLVILKGRE